MDLLLCAVAVIGKGFADSFHKDDGMPWLAILIVGGTVAGLVLQLYFKKPTYAWIATALPLVAMLGLYIYEKAMGI